VTIKSLFKAARAESARRRVKPRPKPPKPEVPAPKGIVEWLRKQKVNSFFTPEPILFANYAKKKGWAFKLPGGEGLVLTDEGMLVANPWATDFLWRADRGIWEGLCPHGIGHPVHLKHGDSGVHGCDGCCHV
jgi:hypothetical protein